MKIGEFIRNHMKETGIKIRWLSEKMNMNEKTLANKIRLDYLTAHELLIISNLIYLDLNELRELYAEQIVEKEYLYNEK